MDRRSFLASMMASSLGGLAGCALGAGSDAGVVSTTPESTPTVTEPSGRVESVAGTDLPIPKDDLHKALPRDVIAAITEPAFAADWSEVAVVYTVQPRQGRSIAPRLSPDDRVIGVAREGEARAYPLRVLYWHEVVNDTFHGPLLVSYCPLCASAVTAKPTVGGEATTFGVSGYLWNADLVMYDRATGSLWSQIAATAIRGPETGKRLGLVPSSFTTWGAWREEHPDTEALLPPPESGTIRGEVTYDYTTDPYEGYRRSELAGLGGNEVPESDASLHPKTQVLGITSNGKAKAYPLEAVSEVGVVNDTVGNLPVVIAVAPDGDTLVGYVRRVEGATLCFERASDTHLRGGGSRFKVATGRAVDGPHEGTVLAPAAKTSRMFWFAWLDFHPDTEVYEGDA